MLSFMAMEYFQKSPLLMLPLVAMALFMLAFLIVVLRVTLTPKRDFERIARLPLRDDRNEGVEVSRE